jgi:hypothetical protein
VINVTFLDRYSLSKWLAWNALSDPRTEGDLNRDKIQLPVVANKSTHASPPRARLADAIAEARCNPASSELLQDNMAVHEI